MYLNYRFRDFGKQVLSIRDKNVEGLNSIKNRASKTFYIVSNNIQNTFHK